MKSTIIRLVVGLVFITLLNVVLNSFSTPIDNKVALMQLQDSNTSLAGYNFLTKYGTTIQFSGSILIFILFMLKDIKKLFGGNANENK
jgi:hypothetical protein